MLALQWPAVRTVAAYIRVSSRSQNHAYQRREIERAALARGESVAEWFAEQESAKRLQRPELDRLRQAVRAGHVARIWVWRVDRLTRSGVSDTWRLIDEFRSHGAELVTVADPIDLDGHAGEVVLSFLAWAAKLERVKIEENLESARRRVEAAGGTWGRPPRVVDPATVERIIRMHDEGRLSIRSIAQCCRVPRSTVHRVVSQKYPTIAGGQVAKKKAR